MKTRAILFLLGACGLLVLATHTADVAGLISGAASVQTAAVRNAQ